MRLKLLLLSALCLFACLAAGQPYRIDRMHVDIDLHKDGSMSVKETIAVTFTEERRGIFRFLPVDLESATGTTRRVIVTVKGVTDDKGSPQPIKVTRDGPNIQIRVGSENVTYPAGTSKTYVIQYDALGMLNWIGAADSWEPHVELYWNVTGHEWDTTISQADFRITFPPVEAKRVMAKLFSGAYGDRSRQVTLANESGGEGELFLRLQDNALAGGSLAPLSPGSGLTVVLGLPPDAIAKPTFAQWLNLFVLPNAGFTVPLFILLGMVPMWFLFGRDPKEGPIAVQFEPPDNISGPEVGTIIDERVDQRDLAAGIISLAVKGYLDIHPQEEGLVFKKRTADLVIKDKPEGPELTPFERYLLHRLGNPGDTVTPTDLRTSVAPHLSELKGTLYDTLVSHGLYMKSPDNVRVAWLVGGTIVIIALAALFFFLSPTKEILPSIVGAVVGLVVLYFISRGMPKRTWKGAKAREKVLGFAEFMRRARGDEFEWMSKKHPDQSLFEEYLPHAVALGLTREWAEAFKNIELQMPSWYHSPYGHWSPMWFASDLGEVSSAVTSAATTPPRSAGASGGSSGFSSGGGFSGGGFGGGGGGSW